MVQEKIQVSDNAHVLWKLIDDLRLLAVSHQVKSEFLLKHDPDGCNHNKHAGMAEAFEYAADELEKST